MLTDEEIKYFKENQNKITPELLNTLREKGNKGKNQALEILDMPKSPENYHLDAFSNPITFNGDRTLKKPYTPLKLSDIHIQEIEKCMESPNYFIDNYVKIMTKNGIDFVENRKYQKDFLDILINPKNEAILGKLPRQGGKSITCGEWLAWNFTFEKDINIGVVANKGAMAREFLDKCKNIIINLPIWLKPGVLTWNKSSIKSENNTSILTDVYGTSCLRGFTINYLIIDEASWIPSEGFQETIDALLPTQAALSKKKTIFITTPNGKDHFYELWINGGKTHKESKNGYITFDIDWKLVPRYKSDGTLWNPEEFKDYIIKKDGLEVFYQNYQCSFIGSSKTLIPSDILESFEIKTPISEELGIKVYEEPIENHKYVMGVDTAKEGNDFTAFQIFDMTDLRFQQVCSAKIKKDYVMIPEILNEYGLKYNQCLIIIENNEGSGQSVSDILKRDYEYENLFYEFRNNKKLKYPGFRTTKLSRDLMLQTLKMLSMNNRLKLVDKETIKEFETFTLVNGKYQAAGIGAHDDLVMATLLSFAIFNNIKNIEDFKEIVDALKSGESLSTDFLTIGAFADFGEEPEPENKYNFLGF